MAYSQDKLDALEQKIEVLDNKIASLASQKKKLEEQAEDMRNQGFLVTVKNYGYSVPELNDDLTLARILHSNNITLEDVVGFIQNNELTGGLVVNETVSSISNEKDSKED